MGVEALADGLEQRRKAFGRALGQAVQVALDLAGRVGGGLLDGVGENLAGLHQHRVLLAGGVGGAVETHVPLATDEAYRWTPQIMPVGPLTIVVSQSDGRVVVMRNGVEIGRAKAQIDPPGFGTHVLVLASE